MDQPTSNTEEILLGKPVNVGEGNGEDRLVPNDADRDRVIRQMVQEMINEEFGKTINLLKNKANEVTAAVDAALTNFNTAMQNNELITLRSEMITVRESVKELLRATWIIKQAINKGTSMANSSIMNSGQFSPEAFGQMRATIISNTISQELAGYDLPMKLDGACNLLGIYGKN